MAAITSTNVALIRTFNRFDRGILLDSCREVVVTLSAQGGTAADIPASALGFSYITDCTVLGFLDGSTVLRSIPVMLEYTTTGNCTGLAPTDPTQATDANRNLRANVTGTWRLLVYGKLAN